MSRGGVGDLSAVKAVACIDQNGNRRKGVAPCAGLKQGREGGADVGGVP